MLPGATMALAQGISSRDPPTSSRQSMLEAQVHFLLKCELIIHLYTGLHFLLPHLHCVWHGQGLLQLHNLGQEQANGSVVLLYMHNKILANAIIKSIFIIRILRFMFKGCTTLQCHFIDLIFHFSNF